jgi:hypothetical protein
VKDNTKWTKARIVHTWTTLAAAGQLLHAWQLRRPDGCKLEQKLLDAVKGPDGSPRRPNRWCVIYLASERYGTSSGRMEQWTYERPDEMARSSGRLTGKRKSTDL